LTGEANPSASLRAGFRKLGYKSIQFEFTKVKIRKSPLKPADLIKDVRKKKGWTQKQLADAVGVTASFITQVEAGKTFPSYERCVALANVLNLPLDELWTQVEKARMEIF
jgi:DNA-binding XRE family transcriptional regulator